jgi:xylulokinase
VDDEWRREGVMFLGIDCGTQGTKALLMEVSGDVLGRGYSRHALIERATGAREQEPAWWVEALRLSVKQALDASGRSDVLALGVSGQQHGLVLLDKEKRVIRPAKLWNDTETAPQNDAILRLFGGKQAFFERFGIVPLTGYTVSKLLWVKQHEPENFARIHHILLPHEYLNFWLTGQMRAEAGDASGTGYFDPRSQEWQRDILDAIDGGAGILFAALPPLVVADDCVGQVLPDVAADLGLPLSCLVSAGGGDNMMGAIGTANVREGIVTLSLGTSSTVYSYSQKPVLDPTGEVAPFCSSSGGWLPLVCTMNATNVVTSTANLLGKTVEDLDQALQNVPPGAEGLVFIPFLNGERTPDLPTAHGTMLGLTPNNFTPDHLLRAAVEGVSFGILNGLDRIMQGREATVIQAIGGGARSREWRQLLADATGATIQTPLEEESGCLGAAIQAIVACAKADGNPVTFAEVAGRAAQIREDASCVPRSELRIPYKHAREAYQRQLEMLYPEVRESAG